MKISPMPSLGTQVATDGAQGPAVNTMRALKMATNATPGPSFPQDLPVSDDNEDKSKAVVEATQPISPQSAALAKHRRALQVKERELADREKAILEKSQGSDSIALARLKSEPLNVLLEAGVTYDQLTEAILASQGNSEISALKAEINALKEGVDKRFVDSETQAEKQVLAEMQKEATQLVAQGDEFELVRETRSVPEVMRLIEMTYRETKEVLEVGEALKLVEEELFRRNQGLVKLKKMQGLFQPPAPQPQPRAQGMRTLTNKDTASVPADRKQRALSAFYGTLKK